MGKDARRYGIVGLAFVFLASLGASWQTRNFIVQTADPRHAVAFAQQAEKLRRELAIAWLGRELPDWSYPCPITVTVGPQLGAGGATSFVFDRGEVYGWRMSIQGSYERIMDSVLPHEITHMIFATHFRRPVPRWADEGGATTVEHESEKAKHRQMLVQFLRSHRGIPFNQMFAMTEYPADIMPLYAQGYAVAEYLIQQGGRRKYVDFLGDGMQTGRWSESLQKHYGISDLSTLQNQWVSWVAQGFPALQPSGERMFAVAASSPASRPSTSPLSPAQAQAAPETRQNASSPASGGNVSAMSSTIRVPVGTSENPVSAAALADSSAPSQTDMPPVSISGSHSSGTPSSGVATSVFSEVSGVYRPGSTERPGIVWTRPLVPLSEPSSGTALAASSVAGSVSAKEMASRQVPDQATQAHAATPGSSWPGREGSGSAQGAQTGTTSSEEKPGRVGPDGWFTAGSRPLYAPGSVGKALASFPSGAGIAPMGSMPNQVARPQMPESNPRILLQGPKTILR